MRQRFDHDGSQNRKHNSENNKYFILNRLAQANNPRVDARLGRQLQKKKKNSWASRGVRSNPSNPPPTGLCYTAILYFFYIYLHYSQPPPPSPPKN